MRPQSAIVTLLAGALLLLPFGAEPASARKSHKASSSSRTVHVRHKPHKQRLAKTDAETELPEAANDLSAKNANTPLLSRAEILSSDPERLGRLGRHIIVGYHLLSEVKALVEARAIAGIFITDHNVRGRKADDVKADIDALQQIRREQGLPPLIVAADQEGGAVSRLSPPLRRQPSLGKLLAKVDHDVDRRPIVENYARTQAAELSRVGVNMNFGPVVDLKLDPSNRSDGETRLRLRAISSDPYTVAKVAGWYCDTLAEAGILCTLKHFPGLGRVKRDTHVASAEISATEGTLELNDWVPFRRLMGKPNVVTMLGHVRVGVLDKTAPASYSRTIVSTLMRETWENQGLLVTDDFSMGAITRGKPGLGAAAVKALNAGVDFLLLSYSEKHLDTMYSALLKADESGELDEKMRAQSRARIDNVFAVRP
ncbi:MAG: glycoside hydrolase family 3 N-terminal domain-containing protein [Hyphomicrobium sp.]